MRALYKGGVFVSQRKKTTAPWVVCLQGGGAALAFYLIGIFLLTAAVIKGLLSEEVAFSCIAVLCVLSGLVGGAVCVRRTPWGSLPSAMAGAGLFAVILAAVGACWTGVDWTGEGGTLLVCAAGGGLFAGVLGSRKSKHPRKLRG